MMLSMWPDMPQKSLLLWGALKTQSTSLVDEKLDELNIDHVMQHLDLNTNDAMQKCKIVPSVNILRRNLLAKNYRRTLEKT